MNQAQVDAIAEEMIHRAQTGAGPVQLATWLRERVPGLTPFLFTLIFAHAFHVPVQRLKQATAWRGLGKGSLSDDELVRLLNPLTPRTDGEWVDHPGGGRNWKPFRDASH